MPSLSSNLLPPSGLRDSIGANAKRRHDIVRRLEDSFAQREYRPIYLPPFERFENVAPAISHRGDAELVRFVDPADDQVAVLPSDATPQVARVFARHAHRDTLSQPWRVFYRQNIVRHGNQRGRTRRQRLHIGCESIGIACPNGELDLVQTIVEASEALGLQGLVFEIGHVGAVTALLDELAGASVSDDTRTTLRAALRAKDASEVEACLTEVRDPELERRAQSLLSVHGGHEVLETAKPLLSSVDLDTAQKCSALATASSAIHDVHFDFGDISTISYYTGMRFSLHLPGLGEPLGSGGRYDKLLGQLGTDGLAIGFSFDVDNVDRALQLQQAGLAQHEANDSEEIQS